MFTSNLNNVLDRMFTISQALEDGRVDQDVLASRGRAQLWLPAMDLYETEEAFVISTDIPGVHMENVDIQFDRGSLTITGERGATLPAGEKTQLRVFSAERATGSFSRSVRLPQHVDAERISATLADGVLTVTVPKAATALPRKIQVRASDPAQISG